MSLLEQIKKDQLEARKARDTSRSSLLTTLLGEASIIGKNDGNRETTDAEVVGVIKKFIKNLEEVKNASSEGAVSFIEAEQEIEILNTYLPEQISGMRLEMTIQGVIVSVGAESMKDMGRVMKTLKENYDGRYDGSEASRVVKELLS